MLPGYSCKNMFTTYAAPPGMLWLSSQVSGVYVPFLFARTTWLVRDQSLINTTVRPNG